MTTLWRIMGVLFKEGRKKLLSRHSIKTKRCGMMRKIKKSGAGFDYGGSNTFLLFRQLFFSRRRLLVFFFSCMKKYCSNYFFCRLVVVVFWSLPFVRQINYCLCVFVRRQKINLPLATGFFFKGSKAFF